MGNKLHVTGEAELAEAEFIVCMPAKSPAIFEDEKFEPCHECGETVRLRPSVPAGPKRICISCAGPLMAESADEDDLQLYVSRQQLSEFKKRFQH